jgi:hypothetical protein
MVNFALLLRCNRGCPCQGTRGGWRRVAAIARGYVTVAALRLVVG